MASMAGTDDPFRDPLLDSTPSQPPMNANPSLNVPDTLAVGRNASLTLGTDSLIVLGTQRQPRPANTRLTRVQMKRF
jgi:sphingosine kinase